MKRDREIRERTFGAPGVRKKTRKRTRSRRAGAVWDLAFPDSDFCFGSHAVLSSLLWLTAEQTGHLRNKHQV